MKYLILLIVVGGFSLYLWRVYAMDQTYKQNFHTASLAFNQGLESKDSIVKSAAFNQALFKLLLIHPKPASTNAAIGAILAHFQEYPLSLFYLLQAQKADPQNNLLAKQIAEVAQANDTLVPKINSGIPTISPLLFACAMLAFALLSLIWLTSQRISNGIMIIASTAFSLILGFQLIGTFFNPIYGVIITSTPLYSSVISQNLIIITPHLSSGTAVKVLDVIEKGSWLKIKTEEGAMGYIPYTAIRVLR